VVFFALVSIALQTLASYRVYSRILKWMSLFLLAYVITGFIVSQDWIEVVKATFIPHVDLDSQFLMIFVGVLGTTISPYMFFWQASQEVEEEIESGELCPPSEVRQLRCGPLPVMRTDDVHNMRMDTWAGMAFSQAATWFIMLTTAGSLHAAGMTDIPTAADAARALEPLVKSFAHSGEIAKAVFALGIIGLGLMAVPIFAGAASYALSETFGWDVGLSKRFREAPFFYGVIVLATLTGVFINCAGINPIKALIYTAVINGVVAVPLIFIILRIGRNPRIMGEHVTPVWINRIGWFTLAVMGIAAILMFLTWRM
ncbi:MAG: divalent metal cation transporter, partial [Armatimonadetes bacterium]|nr:divalent metal cation transporter [Armatimonadota bacterium]